MKEPLKAVIYQIQDLITPIYRTIMQPVADKRENPGYSFSGSREQIMKMWSDTWKPLEITAKAIVEDEDIREGRISEIDAIHLINFYIYLTQIFEAKWSFWHNFLLRDEKLKTFFSIEEYRAELNILEAALKNAKIFNKYVNSDNGTIQLEVAEKRIWKVQAKIHFHIVQQAKPSLTLALATLMEQVKGKDIVQIGLVPDEKEKAKASISRCELMATADEAWQQFEFLFMQIQQADYELTNNQGYKENFLQFYILGVELFYAYWTNWWLFSWPYLEQGMEFGDEKTVSHTENPDDFFGEMDLASFAKYKVQKKILEECLALIKEYIASLPNSEQLLAKINNLEPRIRDLQARIALPYENRNKRESSVETTSIAQVSPFTHRPVVDEVMEAKNPLHGILVNNPESAAAKTLPAKINVNLLTNKLMDLIDIAYQLPHTKALEELREKKTNVEKRLSDLRKAEQTLTATIEMTATQLEKETPGVKADLIRELKKYLEKTETNLRNQHSTISQKLADLKKQKRQTPIANTKLDAEIQLFTQKIKVLEEQLKIFIDIKKQVLAALSSRKNAAKKTAPRKPNKDSKSGKEEKEAQDPAVVPAKRQSKKDEEMATEQEINSIFTPIHAVASTPPAVSSDVIVSVQVKRTPEKGRKRKHSTESIQIITAVTAGSGAKLPAPASHIDRNVSVRSALSLDSDSSSDGDSSPVLTPEMDDKNEKSKKQKLDEDRSASLQAIPSPASGKELQQLIEGDALFDRDLARPHLTPPGQQLVTKIGEADWKKFFRGFRDFFTCPITRDIAIDPVWFDGKIYERESLEKWFQNSNNHPLLSGQVLSERDRNYQEVPTSIKSLYESCGYRIKPSVHKEQKASEYPQNITHEQWCKIAKALKYTPAYLVSHACFVAREIFVLQNIKDGIEDENIRRNVIKAVYLIAKNRADDEVSYPNKEERIRAFNIIQEIIAGEKAAAQKQAKAKSLTHSQQQTARGRARPTATRTSPEAQMAIEIPGGGLGFVGPATQPAAPASHSHSHSPMPSAQTEARPQRGLATRSGRQYPPVLPTTVPPSGTSLPVAQSLPLYPSMQLARSMAQPLSQYPLAQQSRTMMKPIPQQPSAQTPAKALPPIPQPVFQQPSVQPSSHATTQKFLPDTHPTTDNEGDREMQLAMPLNPRTSFGIMMGAFPILPEPSASLRDPTLLMLPLSSFPMPSTPLPSFQFQSTATSTPLSDQVRSSSADTETPDAAPAFDPFSFLQLPEP